MRHRRAYIKLTKRTFCSFDVPNLQHLTDRQSILILQDEAYTRLLRICQHNCKQIQSRKLFDELPQRLEHASRAVHLIHAKSLVLGFDSHGELGNAIVNLHSKCGNIAFAHKAFERLERKDALSWNPILSMYSKRGMLEKVEQLFRDMQISGVYPNQFTYAIVLSVCAKLTDINFGKALHSHVIKTGFVCDSFCEGSLIDMYAKCKLVDDACSIFDRCLSPDTVSWTSMIDGYAQAGFPEKALRLFKDMLKSGRIPDQVAFVTVINACVESGFLNDARQLFDQMPNPNIVAWNVMISGHVHSGCYDLAIQYFQNMIRFNLKPTRSTLGSVLSAIASTFNFNYGSQVHCQATKLGLSSNVYVGSSLMNMYANCQEMGPALSVFNSLNEKNTVIWNTMIKGYNQNEDFDSDKVISLFMKMRNSGFKPDEFTYTSVISASSSIKDSDIGKQLHSLIIKNKFYTNLFVQNALVDMYAKSNSLQDAIKQFNMIKNRDNVSWNAIIVGFVQEQEEESAFIMFRKMRNDGIAPDEACFASMLSACANIQSIKKGEQLHSLLVKYNMETSLYGGSSLVDMYSKCGAVSDSQKVFDFIKVKSVASVNALLSGYADVDIELSVNLFRKMQFDGLNPSDITLSNILKSCDDLTLGRQIHSLSIKHGFENEFLLNSLLGMYFNSGAESDAMILFTESPIPKSTVLWTVVITGFNQNNSADLALDTYKQMRSYNSIPDQATFVSVLKACATSASLQDGRGVHAIVFQIGFDQDESTASGLIDMYAKCGEIKSSSQVFEEIGNKKDVITWNSMIVGYAKNGYADKALAVFDQMRKSKLTPDDVTFLGVLTACSHSGRVIEGRQVFDEMRDVYKIKPRVDHVSCLVDLYGRWGYLKEAEEIIDGIGFEPNAIVWGTFLGACRTHGDEKRGKRASEELVKLEPENSASFVLLSNIYAASGNWEEVNFVRREMREKGVKKFPGCSWIKLDGETSLFVSGDEVHESSEEIYGVLMELKGVMKDVGFVVDSIDTC